MNPTAKSPKLWWVAFFGNVLLVPLLPALMVLLIGFLVPGRISWSIANWAIATGAAIAALTSGYILLKAPGMFVFRLLVFVLVVYAMIVFSMIEFSTSQACVTQQGNFIDLQRQYREIRAAEGASCG